MTTLQAPLNEGETMGCGDEYLATNGKGGHSGSSMGPTAIPK